MGDEGRHPRVFVSSPMKRDFETRDVRERQHRGERQTWDVVSSLSCPSSLPNIPPLLSLEEGRRQFQSGGPISGESWMEMRVHIRTDVRMRARVYTFDARSSITAHFIF